MSDFLKMFSNEGNNIIDFMPMTPSIVPMATGISTIFNDKPDSILDCHSFDTNILYDQMGNKVDVGISSMDQRTKMDAIIGKSGVDQVSFNTGGDGGSISTAIRPQQGQVDLGISTGDHSKTADLTLSKNGVEKVGYGTHGKDGSFDVSLFPHEEKMLISGSAKLDEIGSTELSGGALLDKDGRIDAQIGIEKSFDGAKIVALIRPGREEVEVRSSVDVDETGSTKITGSTILGPGGPSGGQIGFSKSLNPHSDIHGSAGFNRNNFEVRVGIGCSIM